MSLARRHPPFLDKITGIMPDSARVFRPSVPFRSARYALVKPSWRAIDMDPVEPLTDRYKSTVARSRIFSIGLYSLCRVEPRAAEERVNLTEVPEV